MDVRQDFHQKRIAGKGKCGIRVDWRNLVVAGVEGGQISGTGVGWRLRQRKRMRRWERRRLGIDRSGEGNRSLQGLNAWNRRRASFRRSPKIKVFNPSGEKQPPTALGDIQRGGRHGMDWPC